MNGKKVFYRPHQIFEMAPSRGSIPDYRSARYCLREFGVLAQINQDTLDFSLEKRNYNYKNIFKMIEYKQI